MIPKNKVHLLDIRSRLASPEVAELVDQLEYPPEIRRAKTAEILRKYQEHPEQPILAAESDGALVGFIGLCLQPPGAAVIQHIAVHHLHREQGIGRGMILEAFRIFSLRQVAAETDAEAVEFYRKIGFSVESLGEKYPGVERFLCKLTI